MLEIIFVICAIAGFIRAREIKKESQKNPIPEKLNNETDHDVWFFVLDND